MESSAVDIRDRLRPLYGMEGSSTDHIVAATVHVLLVVACVIVFQQHWWVVGVLLWMAIAWMNHAALSRLHESAHRMLVHSSLANELVGIVIGTLALTPLSVYRYVHTQHHAHLGREKDPEFWPYNLPGTAQWLRLVYVWLELLVGWIFTPLLYSVRTARAWPQLARARRVRLLLEWAGLFGFWSTALLIVAWTDSWSWFIVGHLIPAWLTGTMQTIRKFTEHLGKFGESVLDMTRVVVYTGPLGRAASRSQLHVEHHGTHHRWARIPYRHLPEATRIVYGAERPLVFSNHFAAIRDMLPHLRNPRVGPQWKVR